MLLESPPNNEKYECFNLYHYLNEIGKLANNQNINEILLNKNEFIYRPPSNEGYIYEIVAGAVKLGSYSESGEEYVHDILKKGDFFGNLKYLNGQFFEFSKTIIETKLRIYELSFFKKTITNDPSLADWYISYVTKRWCTSEKKLGNICGNDVRERLNFVRNLFDVSIKDANGKKHILYELLTQKNLGDLTGATRQTISNLLKKS